MAMGRKPQHHVDSITNKAINGLFKLPGSRPRWRYKDKNGKYVYFTEADEQRAITRFLAAQEKQIIPYMDAVIDMGRVAESAPSGQPVTYPTSKLPPFKLKPEHLAMGVQIITHTSNIGFFRDNPSINPDLFWPSLRELLLNHTELVAKMTGIPQIRNLSQMEIPRAPITLEKIKAVYLAENGATPKSKQEALSAMDKLIKFTGAKTLADLTHERLNVFRTHIEKNVSGPATRKAYYSRIKFIIAFGLKMGMDTVQIRAALDRCKVLWTAEAMPPVQPRPISREHFHALLNASNGSWRAWLLLGLNLCLHMEEVCGLKWEHFDLEKGTYAAVREKTKRAKIPRAAVLWPETVEALKALPRRGPYVFISAWGTRYNKNTRVNDLKDLRKVAGLPDDVTFDTLRDGAYTAAVQGTEEKFARVLAGHKSAGLMDSYVLRNPEFVRPACDAVYAVYGPFTVK